jgi:hypothetical protein
LAIGKRKCAIAAHRLPPGDSETGLLDTPLAWLLPYAVFFHTFTLDPIRSLLEY